MKKVILAAFAAMSMVSSAFAVTAQSGIYVGALGGWSFPDNPDQGNVSLHIPSTGTTPIPATSSSNRNYTYGATLGYNYAFTPNWLAGLEASYINFGYNNYEFSYNGINGNTKLKNWGIQLMATGTYLMNNGFNVFGKLGAIDQRTIADNSLDTVFGDYGHDTHSTTKWLPAIALGVGYMPIQNLNIALQYERTFGDDWSDASTFTGGNPNPMTQNAVTLGLTYNFAI